MTFKVPMFLIISAIGILSILGCSTNSPRISALPQEVGIRDEKTNDKDLKQACIKAAIGGIELEIKRHQDWLDQRKEKTSDESEINELQRRLSQLKRDLEGFKNMQLDAYEIPQKLQFKAWVRSPASENSILYLEDMTRSGPWYHLVGIRGDDYTVLQPNGKYLMTIYLVYPRYYWHMKSYYVYIDDYKDNAE